MCICMNNQRKMKTTYKGHFKLTCSTCGEIFGTVVSEDEQRLIASASLLRSIGACLNCVTCSKRLFNKTRGIEP
jgi:DNA-directed RNA polymerase subunit RPC12/RpoP